MTADHKLPIKVHPGIRIVIPWLILSAMLWIAAIRIEMIFPEIQPRAVAIVLLLTGVLLARPIFHHFDTYLEITEHHIRFVCGNVSFRKKHVQFPYEDILGVEVDQSLFDRILGIGTISIGTAVRARAEIIMRHVAHPERYAAILTQMIDQVRLKQGQVGPRRG